MSTLSDIRQYESVMNLTSFYKYYLYGNCAYIMSLYPVCLYLLFWRDIKLKTAYKYMLFMCATTTLMNSLMYAIWAPVTNQSFMGGFSVGLTRSLGPDVNLKIFQLSLVILTNSQISTILLLVFQYAHLNPEAFLSKLGVTGRRLIATYICYTLFLFLIAALLVPFSVNDQQEFISYVHSNNNTYAELLLANQPSLITFIAELNPAVYALGVIEVGSPVFLFVLGAYYTVAVSRMIARTKAVVSAQTYKRELMMFRTFVFKTMMMFVFYVIPIVGYTVCLWLDVRNPVMGLLLNLILVSHGWPSYIGSVWLIKPYRYIVLGMIGKVVPLPSFIQPPETTMQNSYSNQQRSGTIGTAEKVHPTT